MPGILSHTNKGKPIRTIVVLIIVVAVRVTSVLDCVVDQSLLLVLQRLYFM